MQLIHLQEQIRNTPLGNASGWKVFIYTYIFKSCFYFSVKINYSNNFLFLLYSNVKKIPIFMEEEHCFIAALNNKILSLIFVFNSLDSFHKY